MKTSVLLPALLIAMAVLVVYQSKAATVSWIGGSGDWNTPTNWSSGALPGPDDDVVIDRPGDSTVTHSSGAHTVKSVQSQEGFVLSGGSLTVSGTIQVNNTFTLSGGTLAHATVLKSANGEVITANGSTLDGVTLDMPIQVSSGSQALLTVTNGLVLNSVLTIGAPFAGGRVDFLGSQTLGGSGQVLLNAGNPVNSSAQFFADPGATLTIGAGITIHGSGGTVGYPTLPSTSAIINQGTIASDVANGKLDLWGSFTNVGTISVSDGTLSLNGSFTTAGLNPEGFVRTGGTVNLTGTLDNTGAILDLNAIGKLNFGAPGVVAGDGTIRGGTIVGTNILVPDTNGTLDGVTLNAPVLVVNSASLNITNGLVLNSVLTIGGRFTSGRLDFLGNQTLGGTGQVLLNADMVNSSALFSADAGATLTIAPGITIHGSGGRVGDATTPSMATIINQGIIASDAPNGHLELWGSFTNAGTVSVSDGTLILNGTFTTAELNPAGFVRTGGTVNLLGTIDNTGATLNFDALGNLSMAGGTIRGGTVTSTNALLLTAQYASGTLDGVTLNAPIYVNNSLGAFLTVTNGLVLNSVLRIGAPFESGRVAFLGNQTLAGTGQVLLNAANGSGALFYADPGATLTIGPKITIHGLRGTLGQPGEGTIINQGTIVLDIANGQLDLWGSFTNAGKISVSDGTLNLNGTFTAAGLNPAGFVRTGGTVNLLGTIDNTGATLNFDALGNLSMAGGTIRGGTVIGTNTLLVPGLPGGVNSGTLDGVTMNAPIRLTYGPFVGATPSLTVTNGLVLNGVMNIDGGSVIFTGDRSLSGSGQVFLEKYDSQLGATSGSTLTIGPGITLHGIQGTLGGVGPTINQGAILADVANQAGRGLFFITGAFLNQGSIAASGGGRLTVNANAWTNSGAITANDATLDLGNFDHPWRNTGTIHATNSVINLGGFLSGEALGTVHQSGSSVALIGTWDNTGTTLDLDVVGLQRLSGGTIRGGTVIGTNTLLVADLPGGVSSGTLDGVTLNAPITVQGLAALNVTHGLVLNQRMSIATPGHGVGYVYFHGDQTLSGTAEIVLDNRDASTLCTDAVLTIGVGITIHGTGGNIGGCGGTIINFGHVVSDITFAVIRIFGNFTNSGSVSAPFGTIEIRGNFSNPTGTVGVNGGTVNLIGTFSTAALNFAGFVATSGQLNLQGSLDNTGQTLNVDALGKLNLSGSTIRGGRITGTNALVLGDIGGNTLDGVTLDVPTLVANARTLQIINGLTLNSVMTLGTTNFAADYGRVQFIGNQSLSGTGAVLLGNSSSSLFAGSGSILDVGAGLTMHGLAGYVGYPSGGAGTIINHGVIASDEPSGLIYLSGDFLNQGLLAVDVNGAALRTVSSGSKTNEGDLEVVAGAVLEFGGAVQFDGIHTLVSQAGATVQVGGNLLGNASNSDDYSPLGTLVLDGSGTAANPQLLEVMAQDLGSGTAGFDHNFAYGAIALANNTYVRLVDLSDNAPGTNAEALYVNSLVVPSGTTLDLNGFHVYARAAQIAGAVLGGVILPVPDGGSVALGTPISGSISVPGQVDDWTFFGRAGHFVTVTVDPGSRNTLEPHLGYVGVQLLGPLTNLVAFASNAVADASAALINVPLPADGVYRVRIGAPASQLASAGNYQVTVWDVTPSANSLVLNQRANGRINTPFSLDQWNFSAAAGQQVRFHFMNASAPGLAFDLHGPNGWMGFTNATADSGLVDLPQAGNYAVTAHSTGGQYGIDYAFELDQTAQTDIAIGASFNGSFAGNGQAQLFKIANPGNHPLRITLQNAGANNRAELYAGFGLPPTRGTFNQAAKDGPGANREVLVDNAYAGTWYVLVYGDHVPSPGSFSLTVESEALFVNNVTPAQGANGGKATVQIQGAGFRSDAQVSLKGSGMTPLSATKVSWVSPSQVVADFDLTGVPSNDYQIAVTEGGNTAAVPFKVISALGPKFQAQLITPQGIGLNTVNTFYVEYSNTGDTPIVAPMLMVTANSGAVGLASWGVARFSLDPSQLSRDFWAQSGPSAASERVTFFASGKIPGVLLPGESGRIPVYFLGWTPPPPSEFVGYTLPPGARIIGWRIVTVPASGGGAGGPNFNFQLLQFLPPSLAGTGDGQTQRDQPMNWESLRTNVPPSIPPDAWQAIWMNYTNAAGGTFYSYFGMLQHTVDYLYRLGVLGTSVSGVNDLSTFQILRADGIHTLRTLASATDGYTATRGLRLSFERSFPNTISGRYRLGTFGRGWSHNWDYRLSIATNGDVTISQPGGGFRTFKPDLRGGYSPDLGDHGQLVALPGGQFSLREKGGLVRVFDAGGKLSSVQDPNGNQITCGYTGAFLTSLTHSSGPQLSIAYNGQGRIQSISDPVARTTTFTYDASGEHLLSAQYYDGRVFSYQYSIGNGAAREHGITEIQNPDLSHQTFTYDDHGRLASASRDAGAERVTYTYDDAGTIFATDALANTSKFFFDVHGLLVRTENPKGDVTQMAYDPRFNLTGLTDPAGRAVKYAYDAQGNAAQITDPLGNVTRFAYEPSLQRLSQLTDANGNVTKYGYDPNGNLLGITYANGSAETWGYDTCCTPSSWVNRRGNKLAYEYDPATGQLLSKTYADGSKATYEYDPRGNLTAASNYTGRITLDYFPGNDRLKRITYPGERWLEYAYDAAGRRQTMTDQLGYWLSYDYDTTGRLRSMTNSATTRVVLYEYDPAGRLARKTLANGVYTTYSYDAAGRLATLTNSLATHSVLSFFNYAYDDRGRRRQAATHIGVWTYDYDDLGQLTHAVLASTDPQIPNQDLTYVYDALGNRIRTIENGVTTAYAANNLNQYTKVGESGYVFDADGNLNQETGPQSRTLSFDEENRLVEVSQGTNDWQYAYDALGNRVATIENGILTESIIDPSRLGDVVADFNSSGSLTSRFSHGLGLVSRSDAPGSFAAFTFDAIGNVQELVEENGTTANRYAYGPFGEQIETVGTIQNRFAFVGEFGVTSEANGTHFMRNRYYNRKAGRFLSEDPIGLVGGDPNLYRYTLNNPVDFIDPSGLKSPLVNIVTIVGSASTAKRIADSVRALRAYQILTGNGNLLVVAGEQTLAADIVLLGSGVLAAFTAGYESALLIESLVGIGDGRHLNDHLSDLWSLDWGDILKDMVLNPLATKSLVPIFAYDPNQKIVLAGIGDKGYVACNTLLPYRIDFENATNATAPAQQVLITDQLASTLDWSTFELTEISFGDQLLALPPNTQHFETNLPMTMNGVSFTVQIQAGIRLPSGQALATFRSVDPSTDLPPPANIGFLPPDDGMGRGQGHVSFLIRPKAGLPSGTEIRNVALVDFANGEVIATDQVAPHDPSQGVDPNKQALVTIESTLPIAAVTSLPMVQTNANFQVCWSARDVFSPITGFDVYVATNGGPWGLWLGSTTNTCDTFVGQMGTMYGFYSVAHDAVGNSGPPPHGAGATTIIAPHLAPQIDLVTNRFVAVGRTLIVTNSVHGDPDLPIVFSLDATAPAGASITSDGVFAWTPGCSYGSTTSLIRIWATDSYTPRLSNSITFQVAVSECIEVRVGSTVLQVGDSGTVPVTLVSTLGLTNLNFTVSTWPDRFTNWAMAVSNTAVATVSVETIGSSQTVFNLKVKDGETLHGPALLGSLEFDALPGASAFLPLLPTDIRGIKLDGTPVGNSFGQAGRVVAIGREPLLDAFLTESNQPALVLYGQPGSTNRLESTLALPPAFWTPGEEVIMTNLWQILHPAATNRMEFFRALKR